MTVLRRGNTLDFTIIPRKDPPPGQGPLGISLIKTGVISYPFYEAVWRGVYNTAISTFHVAVAILRFFKDLFIGGKMGEGVAGPIGIAFLTGQAASLGFSYLIQFIALLSINLAVLNIIPFPALDGGRLLLIGIEKIKGSPVDKKVEVLINSIGFAILITLMIFITFKDMVKFF
jgi:regulator of sigma E protease